MYQYIRGIITEKGINYLVIETAGVGYLLAASSSTLVALNTGEEAKVYTKLIVKEDAHLLCGFATLDEREFFEHLISVSGIGQKLAINILSAANYADVLAWIIAADEKKLIKLPGLGKKTAQRLIVELRDKFKKLYGSQNLVDDIELSTTDLNFNQDIIIALSGLGFSSVEISKMLSGIDLNNISLEEAIRLALSNNR